MANILKLTQKNHKHLCSGHVPLTRQGDKTILGHGERYHAPLAFRTRDNDSRSTTVFITLYHDKIVDKVYNLITRFCYNVILKGEHIVAVAMHICIYYIRK